MRLSKVTGLTIIPSPALALLRIGMEHILQCFHTITTHILIAYRLSIVRHWKTPDIPTKQEVVSLIHTHCSYECMFATSEGSVPSIYKKWSHLLEWYKSTQT